MNPKMLIALAGLGAVGFVAYKYFQNKPALTGDPGTAFPNANQNLMTQPSNKYPYQASTPTRNDNQSEPWYGGSRLFNLAPDMNMSNLQALAGDIGAISDITGSLSSLWNDLDIGNWFGSGGDQFSLADYSEQSTVSDNFSWDSFDEDFGGQQFNYSNIA